MAQNKKFDRPMLLLYLAHSAFISLIPIGMILTPHPQLNSWEIIRKEYIPILRTEYGGSFRSFLITVSIGSVLYNLPNGLWYLALAWTSIEEGTDPTTPKMGTVLI